MVNNQVSKTPEETLTEMNEIVLPNDTNYHGNLMGGKLMYWMDMAAGMASRKHANRPCAIIAVDHLSFKRPIYLGEIVNIKAIITRTFKTSMEVYVVVSSINIKEGEKNVCNEAFMTFVAMGDDEKACAVIPLVPQTDIEKKRYEEAMERRNKRIEIKVS